MFPVGIVCFVSADWEMCCRYKILHWTTDIHVVSCPHKLIVSSELVCCGFVSVCKTSLKESGKWITFDHLPLADRDETCLSRRVWSVGLSSFQDIVLTLKDKLSIRAIEYFALVLEQQYSITKLLLLHEDELIQKVKKTCGAQTQKMILQMWLLQKTVNVYRNTSFKKRLQFYPTLMEFSKLSTSGGTEKGLPWLQMSVQGVFHPQRPCRPAARWSLCLWVSVSAGTR